jgi:hypothetical protein
MRSNYWTFRNSKGDVFPSKQSSDGKYGLEIKCKDKGKVYAFQYISFTAPGKYKMTADLKRKNIKENIQPYFMVWDKVSQKVLASKTFNDVSDKKFAAFTMTFEIEPGEKSLSSPKAIIVGVKQGAGTLYVDNVKIERDGDVWKSSGFSPVNLKPYCNQSFTDKVQGDGKGGWADLGLANMEFLQKGDRYVGGIPFSIIDNDKSEKDDDCIILGSPVRPKLPSEVKDIKINGKYKELYFLQTAMYVKARKREILGDYVIHYADGSAAKKNIVCGKDLEDWYLPRISPGMKIAEKVYSPSQTEHALFTFSWKNPNPDKEIKSMDFISKGNAILALLAVSGKK